MAATLFDTLNFNTYFKTRNLLFMPNFFFSRFRLNQDFNAYYDKTLAVYNAIDGKFPIEYRKDYFKFVSIELIKEGVENYIIGRIVKYKLQQQLEVIEDGSNEISEVLVKNKILAASKFIIRPEEGIIAYEDIPSYIPKDTFPKIFETLFKSNNEKQLEITISPITDENAFFTRIKEIKQIKRVVISLVPSNPSNRDVWKEMDEKLKNDNITNYKEIQENKSPNGSIKIDDETKSKLHMSEDGYGKSQVQGIDKDGDYITVSTKDADKHLNKKVIFDLDEIRSYIQYLSGKFAEIISRTNKK